MSIIRFEQVRPESRLYINPSSDAFINEHSTLPRLRQQFADFLQPAPETMDGFDVTPALFTILLPQTPGEGRPIFIYYKSADNQHICHELATRRHEAGEFATEESPYQMRFSHRERKGWYIHRIPVRAAVTVSYYRNTSPFQVIRGGKNVGA